MDREDSRARTAGWAIRAGGGPGETLSGLVHQVLSFLAELIEALGKLLAANTHELSTLEIYAAELDSGDLTWGLVHSEKFWRENAAAAEETYGPIGAWDVSAVTDMSGVQSGFVATASFVPTCFNQDVDAWNVAKVTSFNLGPVVQVGNL